MYYLIDLERSLGGSGGVSGGRIYFWKQHKRGYCTSLVEAGQYSEEESKAIVEGDFNKLTVRIPVKKAQELAGIDEEFIKAHDEMIKEHDETFRRLAENKLKLEGLVLEELVKGITDENRQEEIFTDRQGKEEI